MRYLLLVAALLSATLVCCSAPSADKTPAAQPSAAKPPAEAPVAAPTPAKDPVAAPIMSPDGLEGLQEVFLDILFTTDPDWARVVKYDQEQLRAEVEAKLKQIPELRITPNRGVNVPRLLVYVNGHTVPGYSAEDPPAFTHVAVALIQPVFLTRRGPAGQPILTNGICDERTGSTSSKASAMRERVRGKVASLVGGFVADYEKANPKAR